MWRPSGIAGGGPRGTLLGPVWRAVLILLLLSPLVWSMAQAFTIEDESSGLGLLGMSAQQVATIEAFGMCPRQLYLSTHTSFRCGLDFDSPEDRVLQCNDDSTCHRFYRDHRMRCCFDGCGKTCFNSTLLLHNVCIVRSSYQYIPRDLAYEVYQPYEEFKKGDYWCKCSAQGEPEDCKPLNCGILQVGEVNDSVLISPEKPEPPKEIETTTKPSEVSTESPEEESEVTEEPKGEKKGKGKWKKKGKGKKKGKKKWPGKKKRPGKWGGKGKGKKSGKVKKWKRPKKGGGVFRGKGKSKNVKTGQYGKQGKTVKRKVGGGSKTGVIKIKTGGIVKKRVKKMTEVQKSKAKKVKQTLVKRYKTYGKIRKWNLGLKKWKVPQYNLMNMHLMRYTKRTMKKYRGIRMKIACVNLWLLGCNPDKTLNEDFAFNLTTNLLDNGFEWSDHFVGLNFTAENPTEEEFYDLLYQTYQERRANFTMERLEAQNEKIIDRRTNVTTDISTVDELVDLMLQTFWNTSDYRVMAISNRTDALTWAFLIDGWKDACQTSYTLGTIKESWDHILHTWQDDWEYELLANNDSFQYNYTFGDDWKVIWFEPFCEACNKSLWDMYRTKLEIEELVSNGTGEMLYWRRGLTADLSYTSMDLGWLHQFIPRGLLYQWTLILVGSMKGWFGPPVYGQRGMTVRWVYGMDRYQYVLKSCFNVWSMGCNSTVANETFVLLWIRHMEQAGFDWEYPFIGKDVDADMVLEEFDLYWDLLANFNMSSTDMLNWALFYDGYNFVCNQTWNETSQEHDLNSIEEVLDIWQYLWEQAYDSRSLSNLSLSISQRDYTYAQVWLHPFKHACSAALGNYQGYARDLDRYEQWDVKAIDVSNSSTTDIGWLKLYLSRNEYILSERFRWKTYYGSARRLKLWLEFFQTAEAYDGCFQITWFSGCNGTLQNASNLTQWKQWMEDIGYRWPHNFINTNNATLKRHVQELFGMDVDELDPDMVNYAMWFNGWASLCNATSFDETTNEIIVPNWKGAIIDWSVGLAHDLDDATMDIFEAMLWIDPIQWVCRASQRNPYVIEDLESMLILGEVYVTYQTVNTTELIADTLSAGSNEYEYFYEYYDNYTYSYETLTGPSYYGNATHVECQNVMIDSISLDFNFDRYDHEWEGMCTVYNDDNSPLYWYSWMMAFCNACGYHSLDAESYFTGYPTMDTWNEEMRNVCQQAKVPDYDYDYSDYWLNSTNATAENYTSWEGNFTFDNYTMDSNFTIDNYTMDGNYTFENFTTFENSTFGNYTYGDYTFQNGTVVYDEDGGSNPDDGNSTEGGGSQGEEEPDDEYYEMEDQWDREFYEDNNEGEAIPEVDLEGQV